MKRLIPIVGLVALTLSAGCSSGRGRAFNPGANPNSALGIAPAFQSTSRYNTNSNYSSWHQSGNLSLAKCRQLCDREEDCPDECADYVYQDGLRGVDLDSNLYPTIGMRGALGPFNRINRWTANQGIRTRLTNRVFRNDMGRVPYRSAYFRGMPEMNGDYCEGLCQPDAGQFLHGSEQIARLDDAMYEYECGNTQKFQSLIYEFDPEGSGQSRGSRRHSRGCSGGGAACGGFTLSGLGDRFVNIGRSLVRGLMGGIERTVDGIGWQLERTGSRLGSSLGGRGYARYDRRGSGRSVYGIVRPKALALQHLRYVPAEEACDSRFSHFPGAGDACNDSTDEEDEE
ncbi:MAG: hypothetical protein V1495_06470 [Pseudomonadota bacterium]